MSYTDPPPYLTRMIDLPRSRLHVMEAGRGEPLIIVPATISELENWVDLIQFMAQWFHVYFFELPGHGLSSPFREKFTTDRVAETVAELADFIGAERFNLMGFSFGGILAMKTFNLLQHRIDRVIMNAPCLTQRAILLSDMQKFTLRRINWFLRKRIVRARLHKAFHQPRKRAWLIKLMQGVGKVEHSEQLDRKLGVVKISTLEVLTEEVEEILNVEFPHPPTKSAVPCYLTMSVHDPLLDFEITLEEAQSHFANVYLTKLYFPFHQPPKPFTFDELNHKFGESARKYIG